MKNFLICFLTFSFPVLSPAQNDILSESEKKITVSGFSEIYYVYDFSEPADHLRPSFIYSHNRHNEINLNLAFAKLSFETSNERANFSLMTGTYANANLAAEPGVLKNIYEANAGIKISKNKNLWLDAGIFPSHIGFESAHSPSCFSLTRSLMAENSPYYESGAKITFTSANNKWLLCGLLLNGWQHIQRVKGNQAPSFGTQISFLPNKKITLNSSSFIGNDKPDSRRQMRYFHNFYGIFQLLPRLKAIAGFDVGMEQKFFESKSYNWWNSPILILRFIANEKISFALRSEFYSDKHGVIISTGTSNGFQTTGYSLNLDYFMRKNVLWRIETRAFNSIDKIFSEGGWLTNKNYFATTSMAVTF